MKRFTRYAAAATFALLAMVVFALAQERKEADKTKPAAGAKPAPTNPQTSPQRPQQPAGQPAQVQINLQAQGDSQLATWLFAESEAKIELAKFAIDRTKNEEVAELARQEVFDHSEFLEQLRRFGPLTSPDLKERAVTEPFHPLRPDQGRPTTSDRKDATAGLGDINNPLARAGDALTQAAQGAKQALTGRVDLARVKQEIARECVSTFKKEAAQKKGADFDKCYVGFQVMGHLHMADTMKVMKRFASADMRTALEQGDKIATEHLDHARMLLEDLNRPIERTASNADPYRELK